MQQAALQSTGPVFPNAAKGTCGSHLLLDFKCIMAVYGKIAMFEWIL